jgi:hypothetical protein
VNLTVAVLRKKPALRAKFLQDQLNIDYTPMLTLLRILDDLDYYDFLQSHRYVRVDALVCPRLWMGSFVDGKFCGGKWCGWVWVVL